MTKKKKEASDASMSKEKPLILVTNDDGVDAKGIRALADVARMFGRVIIVAPGSAQSGKSHAITFSSPIRLRKIYAEKDFEIYKANNTPVDAIKLAQCVLLKEQKIDLLVAGINHGSNSSSSIFYSGTMAAVIEGCINNTPSIGFSLCDYSANANFEAAKDVAYKIIKSALENKLPENICLNVNIPNIALSDIKGYRITRQAKNHWQEELEERIDPIGKPYYWLSGYLLDLDKGEDTDEWAIQNNYVSIQPVQPDLTAHSFIKTMKKWKFN
ncbi:MAG: 5'/3'-nucleotidase SurE [Bacteroidales bacterium]|jgi:5'-nucleotidase|nr:5'/3'-nucleotidase SurE [Bacteroidales bacterium]MDD3330152.1 5'/3'-nucleotidase SurE [Bacteroidales bacterium]MDD3690953.1 5'/3'-nucleotidase SurE [Bacteroidales bacterium]MDD4044625.1 5'/3'-nucleotidase SurE [Bacteroidales bacterium]MDD4581475.1 5'/3'-nucleotidase SurE [Bacteroidales bacterium]